MIKERPLDLYEVKRIADVSSTEEANRLLEQGWQILKVFSERCYILGHRYPARKPD